MSQECSYLILYNEKAPHYGALNPIFLVLGAEVVVEWVFHFVKVLDFYLHEAVADYSVLFVT